MHIFIHVCTHIYIYTHTYIYTCVRTYYIITLAFYHPIYRRLHPITPFYPHWLVGTPGSIDSRSIYGVGAPVPPSMGRQPEGFPNQQPVIRA